MNRLLLLALLALLSGSIATGAHAQPRSSADVVAWTSAIAYAETGATLFLTAEITNGWRVYAPGSPVGRPVRLLLPSEASVDTLRTSAPSVGRDSASGKSYPYFVGQVRVEVTLSSQGEARDVFGQIEVEYTACNDSICLRPSRSNVVLPSSRGQ